MKISLKACKAVAGTLPAGMLLRQIIRWYARAYIKRDGKLWLAFTREEWADETDLSLSQVKRALSTLQNAKLIVREQHLRHKKGETLNVLHLRPTEECLRLVEATESEREFKPRVAHNDPPKTRKMPDSKSGAKCATLYKTSSYKPSHENLFATSFAVAVSESPKALPETNLHEEKSEILGANPENANVCNSHGGEMVTSAELAKRFTKDGIKPINAAALKPDKFRSLELVWKVECARRGMVTFEFTQKARGQLRQLLTRLPKEGTAPPVFLARVIRQWADFVLKAERDHGAFNSPRQPNLAYLLKFIEAGAHLKDEEPPKPKETQTVARPKPEKPAKPHKTLAEMQNKMTKEETLAYFAEWQREIEAERKPKGGNVYQGIRR